MATLLFLSYRLRYVHTFSILMCLHYKQKKRKSLLQVPGLLPYAWSCNFVVGKPRQPHEPDPLDNQLVMIYFFPSKDLLSLLYVYDKMRSLHRLWNTKFKWLLRFRVCTLLFMSFAFLADQCPEVYPKAWLLYCFIISNNVCLYLSADASLHIDASAAGTSSRRRARGRMYPPAYRLIHLGILLYWSASYLCCSWISQQFLFSYTEPWSNNL